MNENIIQSSEQKTLEYIINEQNSIIFDEKNWITKDIWKIAEVTYSYDQDTNINTTLFVNCGLLNLQKYKKSSKTEQEKNLIKASNILEKKLNEKKLQIETALNEIKLNDIFSQNKVNNDKRIIFINSLEEKKNFLEYCINAIPFELEKAGIELSLSTEEEINIESKQKELDSQLFGGDIKDNPEETRLSYEYIYKIYLEKKDKLTQEQQNRFENYLSKINKYLPNGYVYKKKAEPKIIEGTFLDLDIPKTEYILSFNIIIEALEKLEHIVESNEDVKSISDGPNGVHFPTTEKFNSMKMLRFFKLGSHEIETHNITDYNGKQLIGNLRGANSTEKDEGVAMLMEQLFMYGNELYKIDENGNKIIDINKVQINSYFSKTLMGELLHDNVELLDYLELSEIIDPDVISPIDRFNRLKRNNKKGVQHKDTTYTRGLYKAIEEINIYIISKGTEGIAPEDLFLGKISFAETNKLKKIKESKEEQGEDIEIIKPLFISDAIYFIITEKLKGNEGNITGEKFYKYLQNKYPIFNFTKEQVDLVSYKTKSNIYGIVNIFFKIINESNVKSIKNIKKTTTNSLLNIVNQQYSNKIIPVVNKMDEKRKNAK